MAPKLGELLIEEGLLTRKQLEEALKCQVIFGGRLGTNLVEMGIIDESGLLRCLSKQLAMPHVTSEQLAAVTPDIIKLIPKEIAEEYKIIPLSLEKKRLAVAMWDPADLASLDAISFITGYIIIPFVCSELRLLFALEQYYGIKRELRYIKLSGETGNRVREVAPPVAPKAADQSSWLGSDELSPFEALPVEPKNTTVSKPAAQSPDWGDFAEIQPTEPNSTPPDEILLIGGPLEDFLVEEEPEVLELEEPQPEITAPAQLSVKTAPPSAAVKIEDVKPSTLDDMLSVLAEARDRDAIADAVAAYVGQNFERVALFMVKGKIAAGWKCCVRKNVIPGFENFQLSLDELSVLKIVADTKNFYLGPLLDTPGNKKVLDALGGGTAEIALLIPLMMMGRVVTIFYVDGGKDLGKHLFELQKLTGKTALAFEILILKNKILLA